MSGLFHSFRISFQGNVFVSMYTEDLFKKNLPINKKMRERKIDHFFPFQVDSDEKLHNAKFL